MWARWPSPTLRLFSAVLLEALLGGVQGRGRAVLLGVDLEPPRHHAAGVLGVIDPKLPVDGASWQSAADRHRIRKEIGRPRVELASHDEREATIELRLDERDLIGVFFRFVQENREQRARGFPTTRRRSYAWSNEWAETKRTIGIER